MEARQTFRGGAAPKSLLVVLAASAAVALAVAGSMIVKDLTSSRAGVNGTVHAAPGTVLRQDNPVQVAPALIDRGAERPAAPAFNGAPVGTHTGRSSGNQSIEGGSSAVQSSGTHDFSDKPGFRP